MSPTETKISQEAVMLAALEEIAAADDGPVEWHINGVYIGRIARAAIAKAKGRAS
jgi:hypothetical protein